MDQYMSCMRVYLDKIPDRFWRFRKRRYKKGNVLSACDDPINKL